MIAAFLINLDRSPDRLAFMQAEADRIGLQFERVPSVDGKAVPADLRAQFLNPDGDSLSTLSDGEIGCYASHLTVHQRIVREALPYALVLEDDVTLAPDLMATVHAAVSAAPSGWDYIHLSGRIKNPVLSTAALPNGRHLVRHLRVPMNTGGYVISQSGAGKMLAPAERVRPIDVDIHFPWLRDLDVLGVYPSPLHHGLHMPTTMGGRQAKYKAGIGPLARLRGIAYGADKLGLRGYADCYWAGVKFAIARRLYGAKRTTVPVVM
jgi:glycosyl transferase family 25